MRDLEPMPAVWRAPGLAARRRLTALVLAVSTLALLSGGCAQLQRLLGALFERPTLHFESARVRDLSLGGLTLDLTWRVENPNEVGVKIDRLTYAFDVEGRRLTSGVTPKGVEVGPRGRSHVTLPFEITFSDLAASVATLLRQDAIGWAAEGTMGFETPVGMLELPFRRQGETELPRLPEVQLANARVSSLSLTGATLTVDLALTNRNTFALPVDGLAYAVRLAGTNVASGNARPPRLGPGEARTFSLPVQVSFASSGRAVYDAIQSGRAEVGLSGRLVSGPVDLPVNLSRQLELR
jgi:LEA14-like dessication related protein